MYFDEYFTRFLQRLIHLVLFLLFLMFLYHFAFPLLAGVVIFSIIGFGLYMMFYSVLRGNRSTHVMVHHSPPRTSSPTRVLPPPLPTRVRRPRTNWWTVCRLWFPTVAEAICGAGIGWLIVWVRNQQVPDEPWPWLVGVAAGALVGLVISAWPMHSEEKLESGEDIEPHN